MHLKDPVFICLERLLCFDFIQANNVVELRKYPKVK